jgi:hypothetical protein
MGARRLAYRVLVGKPDMPSARIRAKLMHAEFKPPTKKKKKRKSRNNTTIQFGTV